MKSIKNITNYKLENYSREIDDKIVDEGWQKIKPFLPNNENNNKGWWFKKSSFFGIITIISAISFSLTFIYFRTNPLASKINKNEKSKSIASNSSKIRKLSNERKYNEEILSTNTANINKINLNRETSKLKNAKSSLTHISNIQNSLINGRNLKNSKGLNGTIQHDLLGSNTSAQRSSTLQKVKSYRNGTDKDSILVSQSILPNSFSDSFINAINITTINDLSIEPTLIALNNDANSLPLIFENKKNKFTIDALFGFNFTHTFINVNNYTKNLSDLNYQGGLKLNYQLTSKLMLCGQFFLSSKNSEFNKTETKNVPINFKTGNIGFTTTNTFLQTVKYFNRNEQFNIQFASQKNLGLGFNYFLFQKNKFKMEGGLMFNLKLTQYNLTTKYELEKDTLTSSISMASTNNFFLITPNTPSNEVDEIKNFQIISPSLIPSISIHYIINSRTSVIFQPSYLVELSNSKMKINKYELLLKQNIFNLSLGLRFNL
ncbi:MAG: hypothetical protein ACK50L_03750 [Bacteroidota bacterium]